jgi:hypothetical protein
MLFLILFAITTIAGFIITRKTEESLNVWNLLGALLLVLGVLAFAGACIMLPIQQNNTACAVDEYNATKATIAKARESGTTEERSTVAEVLVKVNTSLAEAQHNNESLWFDWYINDDLVILPPLE